MPGTQPCIDVFDLHVGPVKGGARHEALQSFAREPTRAETQVSAPAHCIRYARDLYLSRNIRLGITNLVTCSLAEGKRSKQSGGVHAVEGCGDSNVVFSCTRGSNGKLHAAAIFFRQTSVGDAQFSRSHKDRS